MRRISVVGSSGSGKTTMARELSRLLGVPFAEIDAFNWGPNWTEATPEDLRKKVEEVIAGDAWVIDGNYHNRIGTMVWDRADTVVWLNPPKRKVMWRSFTRTVRRASSGEELWNGNRETWDNLKFWRGEESILVWAWTAYPRRQKCYEAAMADPQWTEMVFYRLRTNRDVKRFLRSVKNSAG